MGKKIKVILILISMVSVIAAAVTAAIWIQPRFEVASDASDVITKSVVNGKGKWAWHGNDIHVYTPTPPATGSGTVSLGGDGRYYYGNSSAGYVVIASTVDTAKWAELPWWEVHNRRDGELYFVGFSLKRSQQLYRCWQNR